MKYVFYLLIVLGAALYFPQSRAVITDFVEPVLTPILRSSTQDEMERIVGDLETELQTGFNLPSRGQGFQDWLRKNYQGSSSREDSWGGEYILQVRRRTFRVVSAGPDREMGTLDDIVVTGQLEDWR